MKNINWARKLTSRKFWAAVVGFVTPMMVAAGATDGTITQVTGNHHGRRHTDCLYHRRGNGRFSQCWR